MSGPLTPVLILGGISYANSWYNTGNPANVKPLVFAGIAGLILEGFAQIPGMEPTATVIGWLAVIGMFLGPVQKPSPADNLLKLTGGGK
jgi:hypothetical protein